MFLRKLGKRGAEMVEYAIVLACIAAVGVGFYSSNDSKLTGVLDSLFGKVTNVVSLGSGVSPNGEPLTDNDKIALKGQTTIILKDYKMLLMLLSMAFMMPIKKRATLLEPSKLIAAANLRK